MIWHCGLTGTSVKHDGALTDYPINASQLDRFIGLSVAPFSPSRSNKKPDFYMLHPGEKKSTLRPGEKKAKVRTTQQQGTIRCRSSAWPHATPTPVPMTFRCRCVYAFGLQGE